MEAQGFRPSRQVEAMVLSQYTPNAIGRLLAGSSSESSDNDDNDNDSDHGESPQVFGNVSSTMTDNRFQPMINKPSQFSECPHGQLSGHPKAYPHGKPLGQSRPRP